MFEWDVELMAECVALLVSVDVQVEAKDSWHWSNSHYGIYSGKEVYQRLAQRLGEESTTFWGDWLEQISVVKGCGMEENFNHLFFECLIFSTLWGQWRLGIHGTFSNVGLDHGQEFEGFDGYGRKWHTFF